MSKNDTPVPASASLNALGPGSAAIPLCILASPLLLFESRKINLSAYHNFQILCTYLLEDDESTLWLDYIHNARAPLVPLTDFSTLFHGHTSSIY